MWNIIRNQKFIILSSLTFGVTKLEYLMLEPRVDSLGWQWIALKDIISFADEQGQFWQAYILS